MKKKMSRRRNRNYYQQLHDSDTLNTVIYVDNIIRYD